jgi:hypothetical protein
MFGGVTVRRVVATQGRSAFLARAQMDPFRADLHAFLAHAALCGLDGGDGVEVSAWAFVHLEIVLFAWWEERKAR